jgi:NlpC/P60 family putative phage cell wall peptidase
VRVDIVSEARGWIGTRWQHQARERGVGVDCAGLIVGVLRATGAAPIDRIDAAERIAAGYGRVPSGSMLKRLCAENLTPVDARAIEPGDIGLFRFDAEPQHLGIFSDHLAGLGLIHAYAVARRVVEHRFDSVWRSRLVASYRIA